MKNEKVCEMGGTDENVKNETKNGQTAAKRNKNCCKKILKRVLYASSVSDLWQ